MKVRVPRTPPLIQSGGKTLICFKEQMLHFPQYFHTYFFKGIWCAHDDPTLNAGLVALRISGDQVQFAKKFHIFVIFQGGPDIGFCRTLHTFYPIIDENILSFRV